MTVYVDNMRAPFGRYIMCHCWADTREELFAMMDRIGVQRKWFQCPPKASWEHFDIALSKRALAIAAGAIETDKYGPLEHTVKLRLGEAVRVGDVATIGLMLVKLGQIAQARALK